MGAVCKHGIVLWGCSECTPTDAPKGETKKEALQRIMSPDQFKRAQCAAQPSPTMADATGEPRKANYNDLPELILRAMVSNYKDGHEWDALDAITCKRAADDLVRLRAADAIAAGEPTHEQLCEWQANHETWWDDINGDAHFNLTTKNQSNAAYKQGRADALRASSAGTPHGAREPTADEVDASRPANIAVVLALACGAYVDDDSQDQTIAFTRSSLTKFADALRAREPSEGKKKPAEAG